MCGICGIIDSKQQLSTTERKATVKKMNRALLHRGPDEGGSFGKQTIKPSQVRAMQGGLRKGTPGRPRD